MTLCCKWGILVWGEDIEFGDGEVLVAVISDRLLCFAWTRNLMLELREK
jgi:hypothetical protein